MKKIAKRFIIGILSWQVNRLRKRNSFKVVGVVGSIGKTSTKFAIANILKQGLRVQYQEGNYNDLVTVPLIFFGLNEPSLMNPLAWTAAFIKIELILSKPYPYDVVVVELGTDGPGQITQFSKYLKCDITVLTAISLEHMEFFSDLDAVAEEELSIREFTNRLIVNSDLCSSKYLTGKGDGLVKYGQDKGEYSISSLSFNDGVLSFTIKHKLKPWIKASLAALSKGEVYSATSAAIAGDLLGLTKKQITGGIKQISPVSGRMKLLKGINNSIIIDESYNSSPEAVKAALDSLYRLNAPQKIAVLGNMNELGKFSADAHSEIGKYCDPAQLDLIVTIGIDANKYTAEYAKKNGCRVLSFDDPYSAGLAVKDKIADKCVVLVKGSQNGVFSEETVKILLKNPEDGKLLVRQSEEWMRRKNKLFMLAHSRARLQ